MGVDDLAIELAVKRGAGLSGPCLAPSCEARSLETTLRCGDHLAPDDVEALAQEYAVAAILYYGHAISFMSDARFDGTCSRLLTLGAEKQVPWLERGMLLAGSGYDLEKFPQGLHEVAQEVARGTMPETQAPAPKKAKGGFRINR